MYLPVDGAGGVAALPATTTDGGTERIVVVDDDETLCQVIARVLTDAGYAVRTADSPEAFTALLAEGQPFDLLVMDTVVADVAGVDLVPAAKQQLPELRVLYLSGATRYAVRPSGAVLDVLEKPFAPSELKERVRAVLDYRE
ncbi:MAG: response regulator [Myxococcota bacterium]